MALNLINAINSFDKSIESFNLLKDVICEVSVDEEQMERPMTRELLFVASNKLRTFGYISMNNIDFESIVSQNDESNSFEFQSEVIREYHSSKTGNILDGEQKRIVNKFLNHPRLFLSAPTSFGKTFILREILLRKAESYRNILLIFPTLSLLNENVIEFKDFIGAQELDYSIISNTHMEFDLDSKNIFILTPERMLKLVDEHNSLRIDFFFMDEIYKMDNFFNIAANSDSNQENERDKVFRITLYYLVNRVREFYLAGPYINFDNQGEGLSTFKSRYDIEYHQVHNELIKKEYFECWKSRIEFNGESIDLRKQTKDEKFKTIFSYIIEKNLGATIIYGYSKNSLSKLARLSLTIQFISEIDSTPELLRFIRHIEGRYSVNIEETPTHSLWTFVKGLKHGLGIHHGSFPKYVQNEVLRLFNNGEIKHLFATTSITEGVNTKAQNILFHGKSKGGKQLKPFDIKNINGRAGRYYHHFIGRIFYFNKSVVDKVGMEEDGLDFITFSNKDITPVDMDNTRLEDLTERNKVLKTQRDSVINQSGIPENVFEKNRLVDRLKQIELINMLKAKNDLELSALVSNCASISNFLSSKMIYQILETFHVLELLDEHEWKRYGKIASEYSYSNGMWRLINYEISQIEGLPTAEDIDEAYVQVFTNIRNVVEFIVPKYLSIYASLLQYVCALPDRNIDISDIAMDSIIRFFELGVRSSFGSFLAESGFPIQTIKMLERQDFDTMDLNFNTIRNDILNNYSPQILNFFKFNLDDFEYFLLLRVIR